MTGFGPLRILAAVVVLIIGFYVKNWSRNIFQTYLLRIFENTALMDGPMGPQRAHMGPILDQTIAVAPNGPLLNS